MGSRIGTHLRRRGIRHFACGEGGGVGEAAAGAQVADVGVGRGREARRELATQHPAHRRALMREHLQAQTWGAHNTKQLTRTTPHRCRLRPQ